MTPLAPELIAQVTSHLLPDKDVRTLRAGSLVCALFRPIFQEALWSRVELDDYNWMRNQDRKRKNRRKPGSYAPGALLLRVLQDSPRLLTYIKTLTIRETQGVSWAQQDPLIIDTLHYISQGRVQGFTCRLMLMPTSEANCPEDLGKALSLIFSMPTLAKLTVINVPLRFLDLSGGGLRQLSIDFDQQIPSTVYLPGQLPEPLNGRPSITTLSIPAHCTQLVTEASSQVDLQSLKDLTISQSELVSGRRPKKSAIVSGAHKLLSICGPSLKEIALEKDGTSLSVLLVSSIR